MSDTALGEVIDGHTLRFVRTVPHSCERVWKAISDEAELRAWMRYPVSFEQRVGGRVQFFGEGGIAGVVFTFDPPRVLAFSFWDAKDADCAEDRAPSGPSAGSSSRTAAGCQYHLHPPQPRWRASLGSRRRLARLPRSAHCLPRRHAQRGARRARDNTASQRPPRCSPEYRAHASQQLLDWARGLAAGAKEAIISGQQEAALNAVERMDFAAAQFYEIARQDGPRPDYAPEPPPQREV